MTQFIQQRYQNYQDNPKVMLDSLINHSKRVIHLDRLVVKDSHGDQLLLTDPDAIKQATIHYFQNVASFSHTSKNHTVE